MAMTRKDFQIVADEFGYDLKRNGFRLMSQGPFSTDTTVMPANPQILGDDMEWDMAKGFTISLNSIMASFERINPAFDRSRFLTAVQAAATKGA
jgi:hypothetical protein